MIEISLLFALPLLVCFTYYTLNFRKFKHSYLIVVGQICLYCISFPLITDLSQSIFIIVIEVINIIFSILFLFLKDKSGSELLKIYALLLAKFLTMTPLIFLIFVGLFAAMITQPIAYLLIFYLLKTEKEKVNELVYLNLVVSWLFLFQMYWTFFGPKFF